MLYITANYLSLLLEVMKYMLLDLWVFDIVMSSYVKPRRKNKLFKILTKYLKSWFSTSDRFDIYSMASY